MPTMTPAEYQRQRREKKRAEGKLPPLKPLLWGEGYPTTGEVRVPALVKDYLATTEGRQALLALAVEANQ